MPGKSTIERACEHCGQIFFPRTDRVQTARFCRQACSDSAFTTHGESRRRTPEYRTWYSIKGRCFNPKDSKYADYGARGITMSPEWNASFEAFLADMGRRPDGSGWSIDRIDVNGDYEKSNCRWATASEQQRNKRDNRLLTLNGVTRCLTEWSEVTGIGVGTIWARLMKYGWSEQKTLTHPIRQSTSHRTRSS